MATETLILSRRDVAALLDLDACIEAVETVFRAHGQGQAPAPGILGIHAPDGGFHIKAGLLGLRPYFVAKTNANFRHNPENHGLPTIQGVIVLASADDGRLLALMDSIEVTILRTGAATAVAAKYLARPDAAVATIVGCGAQGRVQLRAVARVRPLARAFACDASAEVAGRFAAEMAAELGIPVAGGASVEEAVGRSDVVVTCTTASRPLVRHAWVRPGTFVAGVGADSEDKQELDPALLAAATVVTDVTDQAAAIGDLHHALAAGVMTVADVHAELGEVVAGSKPGRRRDDEITVFDSTGMALQDAAAAALVYERARAAGRGIAVDLGSA